jgi:hypothetical protein
MGRFRIDNQIVIKNFRIDEIPYVQLKAILVDTIEQIAHVALGTPLMQVGEDYEDLDARWAHR